MDAEQHSRFSRLEAPLQPPGSCWVTGATRDVIDTGIQVIRQQGRVYLAVEVVREMAQVAGLFDNMVDLERFKAALDELEREREINKTAFDNGFAAGLKKGKEAEDGLRRVFNDYGFDPVVSSPTGGGEYVGAPVQGSKEPEPSKPRTRSGSKQVAG